MTKLPQQLLNSLSLLNNFDLEAFVRVHEETMRPTSIRLNPFKPAAPEWQNTTPVPWNEYGYYLDQRPYFTHDPLFHAGAYYVQEAGSMFLEKAFRHCFNLNDKLCVLDLCAAPGGKSTLINSLLSGDSLLVANEAIKQRAGVLCQNMARWGTANSVVTNNYPEKFSSMNGFFDALVVDAPCSGSGLFRKQPEAIDEWSEQAVNQCATRQREILDKALPALKQNGVLFYSTCSYSTEENENVVNWLINEKEMELIPIPPDNLAGIVSGSLGLRFYPHLVESEGFFFAALRKKTEVPGNHKIIKCAPAISKQEQVLANNFIKQDNLILHKVNHQLHLMNSAVFEFLQSFGKQLYFRKAGTLVGEVKGSDLVPDQELAWSIHQNEKINRMELNKAEAINYLKKQPFLENNHPPQLVLLCYKGLGLGWAKILNNRVNNYLPNELRILK